MSTEFCTVYVTAGTAAEAREIAHVIVKEQLAACANILPSVGAIYRWDGEVEEAEETAIFFKTKKSLFGALEARVRALHSYEVPCIVAWPIEAGTPGYLEWLAAETK